MYDTHYTRIKIKKLVRTLIAQLIMFVKCWDAYPYSIENKQYPYALLIRMRLDIPPHLGRPDLELCQVVRITLRGGWLMTPHPSDQTILPKWLGYPSRLKSNFHLDQYSAEKFQPQT